jgi:hypothetical protein
MSRIWIVMGDDFMVVDMLSRRHTRRFSQRNTSFADTMTVFTTESVDAPQYPRNTVFRQRDDGTYAEIAQYAGLDATEWSWAPVFIDVDLDGFEDVLVPNGFVRDTMNIDIQNRIRQPPGSRKVRSIEDLQLRKLFPPLATPNLAFRNQGAFRFEDVSAAWGFNAASISQGTCLADLDNDGDLDVIVNNLNEAAGLYRNDSTARAWRSGW